MSNTPIVIKESDNIVKLLDRRIERDGEDAQLFEYKIGNDWQIVSAGDFKARINDLARGFLALGIKKGDAVAIISKTSFEWVQLDFALLKIGALAIPIYETSSASQIAYILEDSKTQYVFAESVEISTRIQEAVMILKEGKSAVKETFIIEQNALNQICSLAGNVTAEQLESAANRVTANNLATIVYTSGSTGIPKGVRLTHKNFLFIVNSAVHGVPEVLLAPKRRLLLFLPLAHVFARFMEYCSVAGTVTTGIVSSVQTLLPDLAHFKPTFLLGVPRVFEKLFNTASQRAGTGVKGKIFSNAVATAIEVSKLQQARLLIPATTRSQHIVYNRIVYSKLKHILGGRVEYIICGGAPLELSLTHFFSGAGIPILQGYGLTETAAPALVNRPDNNVIGSVGIPLPGIEVKVTDEGEIAIKSESTMEKYNNSDEHPFVDGWFLTGDLGEIDENGHVYITGRKKDLIITGGGKNVAPAPLEEILKTAPIIANAVVIGDNRPFIAVLLTLDIENVKHFFKARKLPMPNSATLSKLGMNDSANMELIKKHPLIQAEIEQVVAKANATVSRAESIRKYYILDEDFTEENGQLTPSMKVKRNEVIKLNAEIINKEIYGR